LASNVAYLPQELWSQGCSFIRLCHVTCC